MWCWLLMTCHFAKCVNSASASWGCGWVVCRWCGIGHQKDCDQKDLAKDFEGLFCKTASTDFLVTFCVSLIEHK